MARMGVAARAMLAKARRLVRIMAGLSGLVRVERVGRVPMTRV
jgi:hypothetical protein